MIEDFIIICRNNFFKDNDRQYIIFINDLLEWLYKKYDIKFSSLKCYYVKDKKLRLRKNPTYLTDGRLSIKKNNLCLVFNDDLMRKYYKENKYISFIELVFHEFGHFMQLLYLNNICQSDKYPNYLVKEGNLELDLLDKKSRNKDFLSDKLDRVRNFAKWLELSNKRTVMQQLEDLFSDLKKYYSEIEIDELDRKILDILEKNMIIERKIYDYLAQIIEGEHVIENVYNNKQLDKEIIKYRKMYGGRFIVVEACYQKIKFKI